MRRSLLLSGMLLAAAAAAAVGYVLLGGSAPTAEPLPVQEPGIERVRAPAPVQRIDVRPPPTEVTIRVDPPKEPPLEEPLPPPDVWPGEVPPWWIEADRKFRDTKVTFDGEQRPVREIADRIAKEAGFPVLFPGNLEAWAEDHQVAFLQLEGTARAAIEALARVHNLEPVLEPDALRFHQRGKIPPGVPVRAGRIRWAVMEAVERHEGLRPADPAGEAVLAQTVSLRLDRLPLREASARVGEVVGLPVFTDAALWAENPEVTVEAGERPLSEFLARMCRGLGVSVDATGRRIVLFRAGK